MSDDEDALMDTPMTAKEMAVLVSAGTVRTTAIRMTPREWLRFGSFRIEADGSVNWTGSSGKALVTETSGASIAVSTSYTNNGIQALQPTFGPNVAGDLLIAYSKRRIFSVDLTSDGAGAVAATAIVPALAGYTGHAQLVGVWCAATDAATTFTFDCTGGTLLGPPTHVLATTTSAVTQFGSTAAGQTGCPVYIRGTVAADDNKALTVAVAGYAPTQTMTVFGYYWYET